jgi:hypothetical protein
MKLPFYTQGECFGSVPVQVEIFIEIPPFPGKDE